MGHKCRKVLWVGDGDRRLYCPICLGLFCLDDGELVKIVTEEGKHSKYKAPTNER